MTPQRKPLPLRRTTPFWSRALSIRVVPQLETYPALVAFVQTPLGKIAAAAVFGILLLFRRNSYWAEIAGIACIMSFLPQRRRVLLSVAAVYWFARHYFLRQGGGWLHFELLQKVAAAEGLTTGLASAGLFAVVLLAVFGGLGPFLWFVRRHPRSPVARRPVFLLVGFYYLLLMTAGTVPLHGFARLTIWTLVVVLCPCLWYFAYAITDQDSRTPDRYGLQIGTFFPFWKGAYTSPTPVGKGAAYLRKVEVHTPRDLAVLQLKAIKLLIWTIFLDVVLLGFVAAVHGEIYYSVVAKSFAAHALRVPNLGIPTLGAALNQVAAGVRLPAWIAWASVLSHFAESILAMAATNHVVACCRMGGFNILRNCYKPLYATTIAEFWNRYYFYFKELLVEFFFFPCYASYFRKHRRLRLAAATLAAATVGNMLYHFGRDIGFVLDLGFWKALAGFQSIAVYTVVLGGAIVISQLRGRRAPQSSLTRRVIASAGVAAFYCLLGVLVEGESRSHPLHVHLAFYGNLLPW